MAVVMGKAKELVVGREEEVLAGSGGGGRGRSGEAFPFQVTSLPVQMLLLLFCFFGTVWDQVFCWGSLFRFDSVGRLFVTAASFALQAITMY